MNRNNWVAILIVAALAGGLWYANDQGYLSETKASYVSWADETAAARKSRDAAGQSSTLWEIAKDAVVYLIPGH